MKKAILTISIMSLLSVLLIAGCKKNNTQTPSKQQNPVEEAGDGYMQATIDGKEITINEAVDPLAGGVLADIYGANNNKLLIAADADLLNNNFRKLDFVLTDEHPIKEGTYDVVFRDIPGLPDQGYSEQLLATAQWKNENGKLINYISSLSYYKPYPTVKVTITKFTNKKGEYIEGTFSIENGMFNDNGRILSLTDGKFRARID